MVGKTATRPAATGSGAAGLDALFAALDTAPNSAKLQDLVQMVVNSMLRRADDAPLRRRTLVTIGSYFTRMHATEGMTADAKLQALRAFSRQIIQIVFDQRPASPKPQRAAPPVAEVAGAAPHRRASDAPPDTGTAAPAEVATFSLRSAPRDEAGVDISSEKLSVSDVEKPTAIHVPEFPEPEKFATFRELLPAALRYRLCSLTRFFQRSNGELVRELAKPFLLTSEFESRLMTVVDTVIVPKMFSMSRNITTMETSRRWDEVSTAAFWTYVAENDRVREGLLVAWEEAWNTCRQREEFRKGTDGERKRVLVAGAELKQIRALLAPERPEIYDIPPIRNREIDLLVSLLTDFDLTRLEYCFTRLRQMYEQEMDRRWYQDRAREGALRDSLLEAIDAFPDRTGDFLALLCYYCFPNTDLSFLERFTHNKGANHQTRVERLPYLMRFLAGDGVPEVRAQEARERREREAEAKAERERQREHEREMQARIYG